MHLEPVQRKLQPHLKQQEKHSQFTQLFQLLCVAEQPGVDKRLIEFLLQCRIKSLFELYM